MDKMFKMQIDSADRYMYLCFKKVFTLSVIYKVIKLPHVISVPKCQMF